MYPTFTAGAVWGLYALTGTATKYTEKFPAKSRCRFSLPVILILMLTTGCAVDGDPIAQFASEDKIITGSVVKQAKPEGVAETDADIIRNTVAEATVAASETRPRAWNNPETGASGSIAAIDKFMGKHGQHCRGFKTTVSNVAGISFYNGGTCELEKNRRVLSWFKPLG